MIRAMSTLLQCLLALLPFWATAEYAEEKIGCTAIAIDGAASPDGSAFAGMNADSNNMDNRLTYVPPRQGRSGTMRPVFTFDLAYPRFVGYDRGEMYHPHKGQELRKSVGEIPEADSTFGYYEAGEPLMNDQGLGMGESSCAGLLQNRFPDDANDKRDVPVGLLDTVTLMQLALERCATSRCAVETMGELSERFGFVPTPGEAVIGSVRGKVAYDDAAEAYTIADASGEAWVFHVLGGVSNVTKSVWAAQKVPKGHFALVANDFIIGELPSEPNDEFLFNKDLFRAATAAKLWDGKGPLHFSKVFVPDPMTFESPTGATPIPLYASLRRWGLMNFVAPSLKLEFKINNQDYPFSVKVERQMTHREAMKLLRYHYQDTEFDMRQGILAGPFNTPFRLEGGPGTGQVPRGISILRTGYSIIAQTGPQKKVAWFAIDTPLTSVYVPLFANTSAVSKPYSTGYNGEYTRKSASWAFNFVCNFMQLNYRDSSQQDVYPAIESWQDDIDNQLATVNKDEAKSLRKWQISVQEKVVKSWWELADLLIVKYNDGRVNVPTMGVGNGYPQWYADMIGFNNDVHPGWVQSMASIPKSVQGVTAKQVELPGYFDMASKTWSMHPTPASISATASPLDSTLGSQVVAMLMSLLAAVSIGFAIGRNYEQKRTAPSDSYSPLL